jgi:hypothetical protein
MVAAQRSVSLRRPGFALGISLASDLLAEYPLSAEGWGTAGGLSASEAPWAMDVLLVVPRFVREMIAAQERCVSDKAPSLTVEQWLHAQPPAVQRRERLRALRKLGLVVWDKSEPPMCEDGRAALRRLLDLGPSDQRVRERDTLLEQLDAAIAARNPSKEAALGMRLAAMTKALREAEAEQRAAMEAAVARAEAARDDGTRVTLLLEAFVTCALGEIVAHDDFADRETARRAVAHKHRIVAALDAIGRGQRAALERLLESPFAGVRASASAHLLNAGLRHARVVPMLQQIEEEVWGSAGWTAFWALAPDDHGAWIGGDL